jgi:hypothetical protein
MYKDKIDEILDILAGSALTDEEYTDVEALLLQIESECQKQNV